jgi:hypothetical protein
MAYGKDEYLKNARKNCDCPNGRKRKRGRPQKRTGETEEAAEIKEVSDSRTVTKDQKDWRRIVLEGLGTQQTAMHETEKEDSESLLSYNTAV